MVRDSGVGDLTRSLLRNLKVSLDPHEEPLEIV